MMIILYAFIDEERHQYLLDKYSSIGSDDFNTKIMKYRRWQDAQLSLLGRILLRYGLNHYFNIKDFEVHRTSYNKPFLISSSLHFNISHAENMTVCCIDTFFIGIDVEYIKNKINYIDFKSRMTKKEFNRIHNSEDKVRTFLTYWTEKEAILKAHGKGLLIPLQSFEVCQDQTTIENEKFYSKEVFIHEEYQCCIASTKNIRHHKIHIEQLNLNSQSLKST